MITRFTEVRQSGAQQSVPIGTTSDYITLPDGTILTDALGDIDLITNGSIKDQINKLASKEQSGYAPIRAPFFKQGAFVRRYDRGNLIMDLPVSTNSQSSNGITASFGTTRNSWRIIGILTSRTEDTVLHLYGNSEQKLDILGAGDYYITLTDTNELLSEGTYLKLTFYTKSTNTYSSIEYYQPVTNEMFSISQGSENNQESDQILVGIDYIISSSIADETGFNGIINIEITDPNGNTQEDKYHVVFDVQQNQSDKIWTTTVAENFVVAKGLQNQPRSSLGTIYNSKWEGPLSIIQSNNKKSGILTQNSGIGFVLDPEGDATDAVFNQNASQITSATNYRIYSGYSSNEGTLFYDSTARHTFRIIQDNNTVKKVLQITPDKNVFTGTTQVNGNVIVGNNYSLQVAHIEEKTTIIPRSAYITSMAQFQRIINDNINYPKNYVIPVSLEPNVATYLSQGGNYDSQFSDKWGTAGVGFIFKADNHTARIYFFANNKIYRVGYSWPQGQFQTKKGVRNRTIRIYSVNITTQQFVNAGNAASFNHTTT